MNSTTYSTKNSAVKKPIAFIAISALTLFLGFLSGILSGASKGYGNYVVPSFTPPDVVFSIVWGVLYFAMSIALYLLLFSNATVYAKRVTVSLWIAQFVLNVTWPFVFFTFEKYYLAFIWICALIAVNTALVVASAPVNKGTMVLHVIYDGWLIFAAILNLAIIVLN